VKFQVSDVKFYVGRSEISGVRGEGLGIKREISGVGRKSLRRQT